MATKESIEKFRAIYRKEFGVELTDEEATEQVARFLAAARVIFQPMPKAWEGRYNELLAEKNDREQPQQGKNNG